MSDNPERNLLGMSMSDIIKILVYIVMVIIFLVRTDTRITKVEESQVILIESNKRLVEFMDDSDIFHSVYYGIQFKGGKPLYSTYPDSDHRQRNRRR